MKIDISERLFQRLQRYSKPLVDTPESLISRILKFYEDNKLKIENKTSNQNTLKISQDEMIPILIYALKINGGKLKKCEVENIVHNILKDLLSDKWYNTKVSNKVPRWIHNLAWAKEKAKHLGLIEDPKISGLGYWKITELANSITFDLDNVNNKITIDKIKKIKDNFFSQIQEKEPDNKFQGEQNSPFDIKLYQNEKIKKIIENLVKIGNNYDDDGEPYRALECYTAAINYDPMNTDLYYLRGELNEELGSIANSIYDYKRIIEINPPEDAQFYVDLGLLCSDIKDDLNAIFYYSKAIEFNPEEADLYYFRASAFERIGNIERAFIDANFALSIAPNEFSYNEFSSTLKRKLKFENSNNSNQNFN